MASPISLRNLWTSTVRYADTPANTRVDVEDISASDISANYVYSKNVVIDTLLDVKDVSANGRLDVGGDIIGLSDLSLNGVVNVGGDIIGLSDLSLNGQLDVDGDIIGLSDLSLNGNVSVGGSVTASEFIVTGASEFVIQDLSVNDTLKVGGTISEGGELLSAKYAAIGHSHVIGDVTGLQSALNSKADSTDVTTGLNTKLNLTGGNITGNLTVSETSAVGKTAVGAGLTLDVSGAMAVSGNLGVGGSVTASEFIVTGASEFVIQDLSVNNALKVGGNVAVSNYYTTKDNTALYRFPPVDLTEPTVTVTEQLYGNDTYVTNGTGIGGVGGNVQTNISAALWAFHSSFGMYTTFSVYNNDGSYKGSIITNTITETSISGERLQIRFNTSRKITKYNITKSNHSSAGSPVDFTICGIRESNVYVPIHTVIGVTWNNNINSFTIPTPDYFNGYAMIIQKVTSSTQGRVRVTYWELLAEDPDAHQLVDANVSIHKSLYVGDDSVGVRKDAKLQITGGNLIVEENSVFTTDAMVEYPRASYVDVSAGTKYTADYAFSAILLKNGDILKTSRNTNAVLHRSSDRGNTWINLPQTRDIFNDGVEQLVQMSNGDIIAFAFNSTGNEVLKSTDGGSSWTTIVTNLNLPMTNKNRFMYGLNILENDTIILSGGQQISSILSDVWASKDGGLTWTLQTSHAEFGTIKEHRTYVVANDIYIIAGFNGTGYVNDIWKSGDEGKTWELVIQNAPWNARSLISLTQINGKVIIGGGYTTGSSGNSDVWVSHNKGYTWDRISADIGVKFYDGHFLRYNSSIIMLGGRVNGVVGTNRVFRSDDEGKSWYELNNLNTTDKPKRRRFGYTLHNNNIIITAGLDGGSFKNETLISTDNGNNWNKLGNFFDSQRYDHRMVQLNNGNIFVVGGWNGNPEAYLSTAVIRSTDGGVTWQNIAGYPIRGTIQHELIVLPLNNEILVIGGLNDNTTERTRLGNVYSTVNEGTSWTTKATNITLLKRTQFGSCVLNDGTIVVAGASSTDSNVSSLDVVHSYDNGVTWTLFSQTFAINGLANFNMLVTPNNTIVVSGGTVGSTTTINNSIFTSYDKGLTWNTFTTINIEPTINGGMVLIDNEIIIFGGNNSNNETSENIYKIPLLSIEPFTTTSIARVADKLSAKELYEDSVALEDKYMKKQGSNVINGEMILSGGDVRLDREVPALPMSKFDYQGTQLPMSEPELRYPPAAGTGTASTTATILTVSGQPYGNGTYIARAATSSSTAYGPHKAFDYNYGQNDSWVFGTSFNTDTGMTVNSTAVYRYSATTHGLNINGEQRYGAWLSLETPMANKINRMGIRPRNPGASDNNTRQPVRFILVGSNDNTNWTEVYTTYKDVNFTGFAISGTNYTSYFTVNSNTYYKSHALFITHSTSNESVDINQLELYGTSDTLGLQYPPQAMTAATTSISTAQYGNGIYTASGNTTNTGNGAFRLFDLSNSTTYFPNVPTYSVEEETVNGYIYMSSTLASPFGVNGNYATLEFPQETLIQTYEFVMPGINLTPVAWNIYGHNSPASSSATLIAQVTNNGFVANNGISSHMITSPAYYKYYSVLIVKKADFTSIGAISNGYGVLREWKLYGLPPLSSLYRFPPKPLTANKDIVGGSLYGNGVYEVNQSSFQTTYLGYNVFDGTSELSTNAWISASSTYTVAGGIGTTNGTVALGGISGEWVSIKLPTAISLLSYQLQTRNGVNRGDPRDWSILASNDGTTWEVIDTRASVSSPGQNAFYPTFTVNSRTTYYQWFAIVISRTTGTPSATFADLAQFILYGTPNPNDTYTLGLQYPPRGLTANEDIVTGQVYGNGRYRARATTTWSSTTNLAFTAFDGLTTQNGTWASATLMGSVVGNTIVANNTYTSFGFNTNGEAVMIELPEETAINAYRILTRSAGDNQEPRDWILYGSYDGITWSQIDARTNEIPRILKGMPIGNYVINNIVAYKHYALLVQKMTRFAGQGTWLGAVELQLFATPSTTDMYRFPPRALTANRDTITGEAYGNGEYEIKFSSAYIDNLTKPHHVFDYKTTNYENIYNAFVTDGTNSTSYDSNGNVTTNAPQIISGLYGEYLILKSPKSFYLNTYRMFTRVDLGSRGDPKTWAILGSNDETNWDIIDVQSDVPSPGAGQFYQYFVINSSKTYSHYAISVQKITYGPGYGSSFKAWSLAEWELYGTPLSSAILQSTATSNNLQLVPAPNGSVSVGSAGVERTTGDPVMNVYGTMTVASDEFTLNEDEITVGTELEMRLERKVEALTMSEPELRYPPDLAGAVLTSDGTALVGTTALSTDINNPTRVTVSGQPYGNGTYGFVCGSANASVNRNLFNALSSTLVVFFQAGSTSSNFNPFNDTLSNSLSLVVGIVYPKPVKINKITIQCNTNIGVRYIKNVIIRGSNSTDYGSFVTIATVDTSSTSDGLLKTFTFTNNNYYSNYFFTFNNNESSIICECNIFHPYGNSDTLGLQYPPRGLTANEDIVTGQVYGNGRYKISVSSSFNTDSINSGYTVFDRTVNNMIWPSATSSYNSSGIPTSGRGFNGVLGEWIRLEMPSAHSINTLLYTHRVGSSYGTNTDSQPEEMTIFVSEDNLNWTTIHSGKITELNLNNNKAMIEFEPIVFKSIVVVVTKIRYENTWLRFGKFELYGTPALSSLYRFPPRGLTEGANNTPPLEVTENATRTIGTFTITGEPYGNGVYRTEVSSVNSATYGSFARVFTATKNALSSSSYPSVSRNNNYNTNAHTNFIVPTYTGDWVKIEMPEAIYINNITITGYGGAAAIIAQYEMYGSNDGVNWTTIFTQAYASGTAPQTQKCIINTRTAYKWLGLTVNKVNGTVGYFWISHFEIDGTPLSSALIQSTASTHSLQLAPTPSGRVVIGKDGVTNTRGDTVLEVNGRMNVTNGANNIAIGNDAGRAGQGTSSVAIGNKAGNSSQGNNSVAVGILAGETNQSIGSVAVGQNAGRTTQGQSAVAIGLNSANTSQGTSAVAVGSTAGNSSQGTNSVAVGVNSGAVSLGTSSVAVGDRAGRFNAGTNVVAIGRAAAEGSSLNTLAGAGTSSIAIGDFAGSFGIRSDAIAIGRTAGYGTVDSTGNPINRLGQQGIAIGLNASRNAINIANTIAVGTNAGDGIIYDTDAGQKTDSITLGTNSGRFGLQARTVAIGREAGEGAMNVWTTRTTPIQSPSVQWQRSTNGTPIPGGRLVAVGTTGTNRVMYSDDGINWIATGVPEANQWSGVAWSSTIAGGRYVAVSSNGSVPAMFSNDGRTWSQVGVSGGANLNTSPWYAVCVGSPLPPPNTDRFVAVGNFGAVMYSDDGKIWNDTTAPIQGWTSVVWSQELGLYVAVAYGGTSMYSSDGINWSNVGVSGLIPNQWRAITWAGAPRNRFVAVSDNAESGGTLNRIAYSDNGINWTMTNASEAIFLSDVAWAPAPISLFCAVGGGGTNNTMTSADGILWTPRVASTSLFYRTITYSSNLGLFVSVASNGTSNQVMTSNISLINRLGSDSIAMGYRAGRYAINSNDTIAIGREAGEGTIGSSTGGQLTNAIAIGQRAGRINQGENTIAMGINAGNNGQRISSIAIGRQAGFTNLGDNSIAIGNNAGFSNQPANTIILNATGSALNGTPAQTDRFYVAPIRQDSTALPNLKYNTATSEIVYSNTTTSFTGSHNIYHSEDLSVYSGRLLSMTGTIPNITIQDSWPEVKLSNSCNDKSVFGVLSVDEHTKYYVVNSVGEGALWVCDASGALQTGDLITTSSVAGYGQKQADDYIKTYTAARAMMPCAFDETETKPVIEYKKTITTKTREVPVNDASGNPIIDVVPVTDADGNTIMEEVDKLDSTGNPITEEVVEMNGDGTPVMEEVPMLNEDGAPMMREEPDLNADGSPVLSQVARIGADGAPVTEFILTGYAEEEIAVFGADGTPIMEEVQDVDENGVPKVVIVATTDANGVPVMEPVQALDEVTGQLKYDRVPRVNADGTPAMVPVQARDEVTGELKFETVLRVDEAGVAIQEQYHKTDENGVLMYENVAVLDENGEQLYEQRQKVDAEGAPMFHQVQARRTDGSLIFAVEEVRDESGTLVYEPVSLKDNRGEVVEVDGEIVYVMKVKTVETPVMVDEPVMEDVAVFQRRPVYGMRDVYDQRPVMTETQAVDFVPVMTEQQAHHEEPVMIERQKMVKVPMYERRVVYDEVPVMKQVPVMHEVERKITRVVRELREKMESKPRTTTEEYTVEEPVLDANGKYIWERKKDAAGNEVRVPAYEMRYVDANGHEITKEQYTTMKSQNKKVHKCAFIGCVYLCG